MGALPIPAVRKKGIYLFTGMRCLTFFFLVCNFVRGDALFQNKVKVNESK